MRSISQVEKEIKEILKEDISHKRVRQKDQNILLQEMRTLLEAK